MKTKSSSASPKKKDTTTNSSSWTAAQDTALLTQVTLHGAQNWSRIATAIPSSTHTGKQCRERWYNQVNPSITRGPWSIHEDRTLLQCLLREDNIDQFNGTIKWSMIAKEEGLTGRTDNAIKNHWNSMKGRVEKFIVDMNTNGKGMEVLKDKKMLEECLKVVRKGGMMGGDSTTTRRGRPRKAAAAAAKDESSSLPSTRSNRRSRSLSSSSSESSSPAQRTRSSSSGGSPFRKRLSARKRSIEVNDDDDDSSTTSPPSSTNRRSTRNNRYDGVQQSAAAASMPDKNNNDDYDEDDSSSVDSATPTPRRRSTRKSSSAAASNVASMPVANNDNSESDSDSNNSSSSQQQKQPQKKQPPPPPSQKKHPQHPTWLPSNWKYEVIPRSYSNRYSTSTGTSYYSPKCGLRFRSKSEVMKFLHCLEALGGGGGGMTKGEEEDDDDYYGVDEMEAYDLFRGTFSEAKWNMRSLAVGGCGGGMDGMGDGGGMNSMRKSPRFLRDKGEDDEEGGEEGEDTNASSLARSTRRNRNVPRVRYCDIEWDSSQDGSPATADVAAASVVVKDTVSSRRTGAGVKPDFIASSSSSGSSFSRSQRGSTSAAARSEKKNEGKRKRGRRPKKQVSIGDVGYTFRKRFDEGWFTGKVVRIRPGAANDQDRRCLYEDGDEEDLSLAELKRLASLDPTFFVEPQDSNDDDHVDDDMSLRGPIISASNFPKPANGKLYTKMEALKIITSFPKKCQGIIGAEYCDGRERGKVIKEMLARGWVPIAERNLYKYVRKYEAGIPITSEWHKSTRWKQGDLVDDRNATQLRSHATEPAAEPATKPVSNATKPAANATKPISNSRQLRSNSSQLSPDLADKLDKYLESEPNKHWYKMFEKLKEFKNQYGTTEIHSKSPGANEVMRDWAKQMRMHCRKFVSGDTRNLRIDEMRFALLQSIGFQYDLMKGSSKPKSSYAKRSAPIKSSAQKREFVPDESVAQVPPASIPTRKRARVSAAEEPSSEEQEVILLDSLNDVPLDQIAASTLHSNFETEDGGDGDDEGGSDVNSDEEGEDNEWLHKVASLLTTEKSAKGQKRPPSVPPSRSVSSITSTSPPPTWVTTVSDAVGAATSNQFKTEDVSATGVKFINQSTGGTMARPPKRNLADSIFYWTCSCNTVNKYRLMECSFCSEHKNADSKRSLMLEIAEKAIESDEVQLVQEASECIPAIDRPAVPDKVIAYLLQQKIPGVTFSAFCSSPSNELDDYFYWLCGSCTMKNSYSRSNCTACLQPKSALADDSSLLAMARESAEKSKTVKEAIALIPEKDRRAIPEAILDGLVTCIAFVGKGRSKRRCKAVRCAGLDYCVSHCDPLLMQKSRMAAEGSAGEPARGINKINENFPNFLSAIHDKVVNNLNWSVNCIEDSILCGENKPFPLGLKVRKFFLGYGFHDGRIVKIVRKQLVDKEAKEDRPVLVYRIVYNDGDQEDFLHHEISSLRQVFDQANVSPEASTSVQVPPGTCFELKTGDKVTVVSHKVSQSFRTQDDNDRLVVQFENSSKEAEVDLLKFQLAVVRKIDSSNRHEDDRDAPFLEWPRQGHAGVNGSSQPDEYDIGEGLTLSRQIYKSTNKNDVASSFTSSAIDNPRDVRPGVKVRMWDPAGCFNHLSYDPYAATVCEFCGVDNNANQVVICDKCHCGFHTYCLRPVMVNIPKGDWLCSACSGSSNSVPFEVYKNGINEQEVLSFLGLPYQKATRFFKEHSEAIDLFKENSKNAVKQRALSLQITSKYVTFEVGSIKFIRALENSDWRLPVPMLNKKEWATSLSTMVAAMKYCGMVHYSADLMYPPIGNATEEMNAPDLDVDKIHPMSKRNMEIFKAFNHNIKQGVFPPVRVVYDENMGFNVEALAPIQKYTLVGEYTGDVVTVDRSGTSNSDSLMLLLQTEDPETSLIIDPTISGNYSRFFSGINNRNLLSKRKANVRTRRFAMDGRVHVALFTSRDVDVGEILSYDYNAGNHGKCVEEWAKAGFYDTSNFF